MNLFQQEFEEKENKRRPLADRIRPKKLEEFVGQEHILGKGKILRKIIESDQIPSMIFWGPPGTGKTTLAKIIAKKTAYNFIAFSAVTSGIPEVKKVIEEAKKYFDYNQKKTILFIDEIHRFNKAQQDAFLPHVENGTIILIGATTENPSFELNSPLLSRCKVFHFRQLEDKEIEKILKRALSDKENGLANYNPQIEPKVIKKITHLANGDARVALNLLELVVLNTYPDKDKKIKVELKNVEDLLKEKTLRYDKATDEHYDTISAFIKSIRGSDPDAALYWLARMLEAGEDPRFIVRRMIILASEDIGNADPLALVLATSAAHALEYVGMPEARINLAQVVIYLSLAPKSNASYKAINNALDDVRNKKIEPVPLHLRNPSNKLLADFSFGKNYLYPHDFPGHYVNQDYLPKNLKNKRYYYPSDEGKEKEIKKRIKKKYEN